MHNKNINGDKKITNKSNQQFDDKNYNNNKKLYFTPKRVEKKYEKLGFYSVHISNLSKKY